MSAHSACQNYGAARKELVKRVQPFIYSACPSGVPLDAGATSALCFTSKRNGMIFRLRLLIACVSTATLFVCGCPRVEFAHDLFPPNSHKGF